MTLDLLSQIPAAAWLIIAALAVFGGVILFALHRKGDVFAEVSHGQTIFKLEAKERKSGLP
jgi:hypothetical protein